MVKRERKCKRDYHRKRENEIKRESIKEIITERDGRDKERKRV